MTVERMSLETVELIADKVRKRTLSKSNRINKNDL